MPGSEQWMDIPLLKFGLESGHVTELGGADGSEVFRVGKQDCPTIADPVMKVNLALRGLSSKVRGCIIDA